MILACQKLLGQITKVLGFGETLPPHMGKTPKKSRIFFLTGSLSGLVMLPQLSIKAASQQGRLARICICMESSRLTQSLRRWVQNVNLPSRAIQAKGFFFAFGCVMWIGPQWYQGKASLHVSQLVKWVEEWVFDLLSEKGWFNPISGILFEERKSSIKGNIANFLNQAVCIQIQNVEVFTPACLPAKVSYHEAPLSIWGFNFNQPVYCLC